MPNAAQHKLAMALKPSERDNFIYLTVALLVLLFLLAIAAEFSATISQQMVRGAILLTLVVSMGSVRLHRKLFSAGVGFIGALLLLGAAGYWLDNTVLRLLQIAWVFTFLTIIASLALKHVLFTAGPIDANRVLGAICVYLLLGLDWALICLAIAELNPGAFTGLGPGDWLQNFTELVYFSFVTLTTLGYGDISPAGPVARFLVYLEAICGQLYLAIMVAGLIGLRVATRAPRE